MNVSKSIAVVSFAALLVAGGSLGVLDATDAAAGPTTEEYATVEFPEQHFPAGSTAFQLDIGPAARTIIHVWHEYERGGFGSSPDHAANFLVSEEMLLQDFDLRPGGIPEPATPCQWSHVYRSVLPHGTAHAVSVRAEDTSLYVNLNDDGTTAWRSVDPLANPCSAGNSLTSGFHWWVFTSTAPQSIAFSITNARLLQGPLQLGAADMKVFTSGDFASEASVSTLPVPGVGAFATLDAAATISTEGPAYAFAQVTHNAAGTPNYRLLDPIGREVEMRQKVYGAEGIVIGPPAGPAGVLAPLTLPQADVLFPAGGTWRAEIDASAGTRMEFILYVVDLNALADP